MWHSIESAPKDRNILLYGRDGLAVGYWDHSKWDGGLRQGWFVPGTHSKWNPEFWMEIPELPVLKPIVATPVEDLKPIDWVEENRKCREMMRGVMEEFYSTYAPK